MKSVYGAPSVLDDIFNLVESDLQKVELSLKANAGSSIPLIDDINRYLHDSGGKRFRPLLLLLCSKMCGAKEDSAIRLSVIIELIHVATLVHDDILDDAGVRRGRASVNAKWGNQITVLMGDWLYMTSFALSLELRDFRILDLLIDITRGMIEGELLQLRQQGIADLSVEEQLDICYRKTAHLFSGCGRLGAILGNVDSNQEKKLGAYGNAVGMAFQLIDDLLDYSSDEGTLGKPVLKDLEEGKTTLPIIYLLQRANRTEQKFVRDVIANQDFTLENKKEIIRLIHSHKTLEEVVKLATKYALDAKQALLDFPESAYREALLRFPEFVINREK